MTCPVHPTARNRKSKSKPQISQIKFTRRFGLSALGCLRPEPAVASGLALWIGLGGLLHGEKWGLRLSRTVTTSCVETPLAVFVDPANPHPHPARSNPARAPYSEIRKPRTESRNHNGRMPVIHVRFRREGPGSYAIKPGVFVRPVARGSPGEDDKARGRFRPEAWPKSESRQPTETPVILVRFRREGPDHEARGPFGLCRPRRRSPSYSEEAVREKGPRSPWIGPAAGT